MRRSGMRGGEPPNAAGDPCCCRASGRDGVMEAEVGVTTSHDEETPDRRDAGRSQELPQLGELVALVHPGRQHGDDEPALGLRSGRGVRLMVAHSAIMPGIPP